GGRHHFSLTEAGGGARNAREINFFRRKAVIPASIVATRPVVRRNPPLGGNARVRLSVPRTPHIRGPLTKPRDPGFSNLNNVRIGQTSEEPLRGAVRLVLEVFVGARRSPALSCAVAF